ncbi:MAG: hypothetical protein JO270_20635 [Acidobacteriaceae bacterium]|nr:hypothetical protein [Acidobacteriaceae bacterium]
MPVTARTSYQFFWEDSTIRRDFRSGVSLHSHTMYSEESLDMVPRYTARVPYLGRAIRQQEAEYSAKNGRTFDFGRAFWTPPLAPRQAYRLEEKQIQRKLHLPALVSLTDHDDIQAGTLLHVLDRFGRAPISTEWTIPFGPTFFHLGVHNLPAAESAHLMESLRAYTANPQEARLAELLQALNAYPDVLVILNHPCWDEKGVGGSNHHRALLLLLERHGHLLHALELNGLRSWHENKRVMSLGEEKEFPLISGGDRHGREPNAILNLSRASGFAEFVHEVRYERNSDVVFMPQYHEPIKLRVLQTMLDVVRDYPENAAGRRVWEDRVFYRDPQSGATSPISQIWTDGGPMVVRHFIKAMRLLEWRGVRSALKLALNDRSTVWRDEQAAV